MSNQNTAQITKPKDPNTATAIEIIAGLFGFMGIGYIYAGFTIGGIVRLIGWWITIVIACTIFLLIIPLGFALTSNSSSMLVSLVSTGGMCGLFIFIFLVPIISGVMLRLKMLNASPILNDMTDVGNRNTNQSVQSNHLRDRAERELRRADSQTTPSQQAVPQVAGDRSGLAGTSRREYQNTKREIQDSKGRTMIITNYPSGDHIYIRVYDANTTPTIPENPTSISDACGCANLHLDRDIHSRQINRIRLQDIEVRKSYRGLGIGGYILKEIEMIGRFYGVPEIYGTSPEDHATREWYISHGYGFRKSMNEEVYKLLM